MRRSRYALCTAMLVSGLVPGLALAQDAPAAAPGVEEDSQPLSLDAVALVPADMRQGPNYKVLDTVQNDGLFNTYQVQTDYGPLTVDSTQLLLQRIQELNALHAMEDLQKTKVFTEALKKAGVSPFKTVGSLVTKPVSTVKNIGTGIGKWVTDVGHSVVSSDPDQQGVLSTALGQAPTKRKFAFQYGVDPYSSYKPLQDALNHLAWVSVSGGITVKAAFGAVDGKAGTALKVGGTAGGMKKLVRDHTPAEINKTLKQQLGEVGVSKESRKKFLDNAFFNPQERALLVGAVVDMKGVENLHVMVDAAASAPSEEVALYMRVRAQQMSAYMKNHPVSGLAPAGSAIFMQTEDGNLVGVFPLDHLRWTPRVAGLVTTMNSKLEKKFAQGGKQILVSGDVDPAATQGMAEQGWKIEGGFSENIPQ